MLVTLSNDQYFGEYALVRTISDLKQHYLKSTKNRKIKTDCALLQQLQQRRPSFLHFMPMIINTYSHRSKQVRLCQCLLDSLPALHLS